MRWEPNEMLKLKTTSFMYDSFPGRFHWKPPSSWDIPLPAILFLCMNILRIISHKWFSEAIEGYQALRGISLLTFQLGLLTISGLCLLIRSGGAPSLSQGSNHSEVSSPFSVLLLIYNLARFLLAAINFHLPEWRRCTGASQKFTNLKYIDFIQFAQTESGLLQHLRTIFLLQRHCWSLEFFSFTYFISNLKLVSWLSKEILQTFLLGL